MAGTGRPGNGFPDNEGNLLVRHASLLEQRGLLTDDDGKPGLSGDDGFHCRKSGGGDGGGSGGDGGFVVVFHGCILLESGIRVQGTGVTLPLHGSLFRMPLFPFSYCPGRDRGQAVRLPGSVPGGRSLIPESGSGKGAQYPVFCHSG